MLSLILKLTLAPALVAVATQVARRLRPRAGGLVSGLPVVAAPIELIYAVEHGERYARTASAAAALGVISSVAFCVTYARTARRHPPVVALVTAAAAFALVTVLLDRVHPPLAAAAVLALAAIALGARTITVDGLEHEGREPAGDLLALRLMITVVLVLAVTAVAQGLPPHLAGLLVPVPIITAVMAGFAHVRAGPGAAIELLGGLVPALTSFLAYFVVLAALLGLTGQAAAFVLATVASITTWTLLIVPSLARPRETDGSRRPTVARFPASRPRP